MDEKKKYIKWLLWIPTIIMMIIIFMFSAKPANVSAATSSPIADAILRVFEAMFGKFDAVKRIDALDFTNFIVRKTAHMTEYAVLAICISIGMTSYKITEKKRLIIAWIASVLYAATDEYHQTFIEGRSGSIKDVGIDATGVLIGCFLFFLIVRCIINKKKKKAAGN